MHLIVTHLVLHYAGVASGFHNLYNNYLKPWAVPIGVLGVAVGGLTYSIAGAFGSASHGAAGLRAVMYAIAGVFIVYSAVDIIAIATGIAK